MCDASDVYKEAWTAVNIEAEKSKLFTKTDLDPFDPFEDACDINDLNVVERMIAPFSTSTPKKDIDIQMLSWCKYVLLKLLLLNKATRIDVQTMDRPLDNAYLQIKIGDSRYFCKFTEVPVGVNGVDINNDDIIIDSITGQALMSDPSLATFAKAYTIKYIGSFKTILRLAEDKWVWPIRDIFNNSARDAGDVWFYTTVYESLPCTTVSLASIINKTQSSPHYENMMNAIPSFINALKEVGSTYGFLHTDMHLDNVFYNPTNKSIVLIDYGRCVVLQHDTKMYDTFARIECLRNGRYVSTYTYFINSATCTSCIPWFKQEYSKLLEKTEVESFIASIIVLSQFCSEMAGAIQARALVDIKKPIKETVSQFPIVYFTDNGGVILCQGKIKQTNILDDNLQVALAAFNTFIKDDKNSLVDKALAEGLLYYALIFAYDDSNKLIVSDANSKRGEFLVWLKGVPAITLLINQVGTHVGGRSRRRHVKKISRGDDTKAFVNSLMLRHQNRFPKAYNTVKLNGKSYIVRIGPNNGRYVIMNHTKKYIKHPSR